MVQLMKTMKRFVGKALDSFGMQVIRKGSHVAIHRRIEAANELEAMYRQFVFTDLPQSERRAELLAKLEGTHIGEAIYLLNALHSSIGLPGDICQFGVAQGSTSALMANEISTTDKKLWLFDSFEGLPRPTDKDVLIDDIFNLGSMENYTGTMATKPEEVVCRLKSISFPLSRVQIVPGFIENTIHKAALPKTVCFSYVDFDFYEPIKIALEFLHERMPVGGHIVVDDYGYFSAGAKTAVDEFVAA